MRSITRNLVLWNVVAIILTISIACIILYCVVCIGFTQHFDDATFTKLDAILKSPEFRVVVDQSTSKQAKKTAISELTSTFDLEGRPFDEEWTYVQIRTPDRKDLFLSPTLDERSLFDKIPATEQDIVTKTFISEKRRRVRLFVFKLNLEEHFSSTDVAPKNRDFYKAKIKNGVVPEFVEIAIARDSAFLSESFSILQNMLLIFGAVVIISVFIITYYVTRVGIKPLSTLASEIEQLDEKGTNVRVLSVVPKELISIKSRLNEYLTRIENAFEREREFSDDIAHELKTPLAGLMVQIEYAIGNKLSHSEQTAILKEARGVVVQMDKLVNHLLELSRLDSNRFPLDLREFDVSETLLFVWESLPVSNPRNFELNWNVQENVLVETDLMLFSQMMTNLFENSQSYVDNNGEIFVECSAKESEINITVKNSGCRLTSDQVQLSSKRLWRADKSRGNSDRHAGLGLPIAKKIVHVLGGRLDISTSEGFFICQISLNKNPSKLYSSVG